jgi:hypothetical protein
MNLFIERLQAENKFLDCSSIYEKYLNDPENAILNLISGSYWQEAISMVCLIFA